jgi:hypothetical protein
MPRLIPVEVECYAGNRADERPRRVRLEGREHRIDKLLASSIEEAVTRSERSYRYTVLTEDGTRLELLRTGKGEWFLVSESQS